MSDESAVAVEHEAPAVEATPAKEEPKADPRVASEAKLTKLFGPEDTSAPDGLDEMNLAKPEKKEQPKAEEEPQEPDKDDEYSSAFQVLMASGVPTGVLKNASRADLIKWGQKQAKREADIRIALQERADLQKKLESPAVKTTDKPEPSISGMPTGEADLKAALAPITEVFGADLEKPLLGFGQSVIAQAVAAVEAKYADMIGGMSSGATAGDEVLLERTRERLGERFPKLSDDTEFGKVFEKMKVLGATGAYADMPTLSARARACMEDACGLVFRSEEPAVDRQAKSDVSRSRDNGQPLAGTSKTPSKPKSVKQKGWEAFNAREEGATDDQIARIMRG